ncbi:MAG: hypothetical protein LBR92_00270 [Puniceicoccales bacterium]|jgi:hypothetical protein|nr:hypothetical protein [Puniceicoccales bacterium]
MKTLALKLKLGLLSPLCISALFSNGFASGNQPIAEKKPQVPHPIMDRLRKETRASMDLSHPYGNLGKIKDNAMRILIPGDPWYAGRYMEAISDEQIENATRMEWAGYHIDECISKLGHMAKLFNTIADNPDLPSISKARYAALNSVAIYFMDAFQMLKNNLSADDILAKLNESFRRDQKASRVRGYFLAVEQRLMTELSKLSSNFEFNNSTPELANHHEFSLCNSIGGTILGVGLSLFFLWFGYR